MIVRPLLPFSPHFLFRGLPRVRIGFFPFGYYRGWGEIRHKKFLHISQLPRFVGLRVSLMEYILRSILHVISRLSKQTPKIASREAAERTHSWPVPRQGDRLIPSEWRGIAGISSTRGLSSGQFSENGRLKSRTFTARH